jgi:hypothetical protein
MGKEYLRCAPAKANGVGLWWCLYESNLWPSAPIHDFAAFIAADC